MKILHRIENMGFYVDENSNVFDLDMKHIYCFYHIDERLYLRYDGFISCIRCEKILNIEEFRNV